MEIVLFAVTVISLLVAFIMSAAAWRLSREERARSAARVAALAGAASEPELVHRRSSEVAGTVTAGVEPVAVGEVRGPAPWAAARVSTFASTSRTSGSSRPSSSREARADARTGEMLLRGAAGDDFPVEHAASVGDGFLGSAVSPAPTSGGQRNLAIAAVILFVVVVSGGYWTVYGGRSAPAATTVSAAGSAPLELVSLRHERRGSRLALTGLVRNPIAGAALEKLNAVVFLFDQQGSFVSSARADVDFLRLAPGDESPFVISVEAPGSVARYRVSFRNDRGIVPHVDRRGQEPVAPAIVGGSAGARP
jgi:hypothetical protein